MLEIEVLEIAEVSNNVKEVKTLKVKRGQARPAVKKEEPTEAEVQKQVRETLERLQGKSSKNKGAKYRREKRDQHRKQQSENIKLHSRIESIEVDRIRYS